VLEPKVDDFVIYLLVNSQDRGKKLIVLIILGGESQIPITQNLGRIVRERNHVVVLSICKCPVVVLLGVVETLSDFAFSLLDLAGFHCLSTYVFFVFVEISSVKLTKLTVASLFSYGQHVCWWG
jgi:hypothetical protein